MTEKLSCEELAQSVNMIAHHKLQANVMKGSLIKSDESLSDEIDSKMKYEMYPLDIDLGSIINVSEIQSKISLANIQLEKEMKERKKAEAALRDLNLYNRSLIETSLDPIVTIDPDGKISDVNSATEQVTGYRRNNLIGTDFSDYFTDPDKAQQVYRLVFQEGTVRDYPLEIRHCDGHITPVLCHAAVYHDHDGNICGVFASARDITERKQTEAEKDSILFLPQNLPEEGWDYLSS